MIAMLFGAILVVGLCILHATAGTGYKYNGLRSIAQVLIFIGIVGIMSQIRCNVGGS